MAARHDHSVAGARAASEAGELEAWVASFLASDGSDNAELGEELKTQREFWIGPIEIEFERLHRLVGPPDHPTLERLTDDDLETVEEMVDSLDDGWEPAPFVVTFSEDHLVLEDGNHRVEGLRRAGHDRYWSVVGFDSDAERAAFVDSN